MRQLERLIDDVAVLGQFLRGMPRSNSHAERLQAFYAPQADRYDAFRDRLLPGRRELIELLRPAPGARIVEVGAGTGRNLAYFGAAIPSFSSVELVDLCPALLERARMRAVGRPNVRVVEADAVSYRPALPVDCVYFSFALTMIPDWRAALANAVDMLRPGGQLGVVDFYVTPPPPSQRPTRDSALSRWFWRSWFAHDGVHLNAEHLPALCCLLPIHQVIEGRTPIPYLPGLRAPYFVFVNRSRLTRADRKKSACPSPAS